jgi:hypothetical protein
LTFNGLHGVKTQKIKLYVCLVLPKKTQNVGFDVLKAMITKNSISLDIMPYSPLKVNRRRIMPPPSQRLKSTGSMKPALKQGASKVSHQ